eukprot:gene19218-biopygen5934
MRCALEVAELLGRYVSGGVHSQCFDSSGQALLLARICTVLSSVRSIYNISHRKWISTQPESDPENGP